MIDLFLVLLNGAYVQDTLSPDAPINWDCEVVSFREELNSTPAYHVDSLRRNLELGESLISSFPSPIVGYNPKEDKIQIEYTENTETIIVELRRLHVILNGPVCPIPEAIESASRCNTVELATQRGTNSDVCSIE